MHLLIQYNSAVADCVHSSVITNRRDLCYIGICRFERIIYCITGTSCSLRIMPDRFVKIYLLSMPFLITWAFIFKFV